MEIKLPNGTKIHPIGSSNGRAPFPFVSIDDAISDLPRFDWRSPRHTPFPADHESISTVVCDQTEPYVGLPENTPYHSKPKTTFQEYCRNGSSRAGPPQHFTRPLKCATVDRVISIPLQARADYHSLKQEQWEWQFSHPTSAVAKGAYKSSMCFLGLY
ncbi:hypothetical protein FA95DRAFT_813229 [Auriscalpium vulgare]|uniref:Uncharacterized protein n=1 Tax=Auriscalpium vulgare TaxID=40419 RepID=A0ACB8R9P1_9AGAM|nr:hypothetical protein FA95DRAFT_813229 [Auriscalpium vulgare]